MRSAASLLGAFCRQFKGSLNRNVLIEKNESSLTFVPAAKLTLDHCSQRRMSTKAKLADRLKGTEKNIWVEFGKLAVEHKALNLGQGFPDYPPPQHVVNELVKAVTGNNSLVHQYTRSYGNPHLVNTLAKLYGPFLGRDVDPMNEITISVGAYGILFCAVQGLINPGDEVIIIEPFFDCYEPMVMVAGGKPVCVPLRPAEKDGILSSADWKLDPEELSSKFSSRTKAIIVNNPNNPLGKVFNRDELEMIADLCKKHDVICISDEVYEWMVYDGKKHIKIGVCLANHASRNTCMTQAPVIERYTATLPGMWERTITVGSAGKAFSVTGWKLGWGIGPAHLIKCLQVLHQNCIYTCPTPIQEAVASGLDYEITQLNHPEKCYLYTLAKELLPKRELLAKTLSDFGMIPTIPEGGYFMMADISKLNLAIPDDGTDDAYDFKFVRWMTKEKKFTAIPTSAFYSRNHRSLGEKFVRFCFIKDDKTLQKAGELLRDWKASLV